EHLVEEEYDALVVGSTQGLHRVEPDGSGSRLISPLAALAPRWLSLGSVLVIRPLLAGQLERGAVLERVWLHDGKRTQLAELPAFACAGGKKDSGLGLDLHDPRDFRVVHEAHVACLRLMDRNANMANVVVDAEIDLNTGAVARTLSVGAPQCKSPFAPANPAKSACNADSAGDERVVEQVNAYRFTFAREQLIDTKQANKPVLTLREYQEEEMSPTGRWLVLGGDPVESDYLYRRLVLLDRNDGALFALTDKPGPWPEPLARPEKKARALSLPIEQAALVPRETEARWIDARGQASEEAPGGRGQELLVVGTLVVAPGKASFELPGELAR
ncbi:MAG TPA: hypothetical protein VFZ61_25560, partial [Polyangiales bacterium]